MINDLVDSENTTFEYKWLHFFSFLLQIYKDERLRYKFLCSLFSYFLYTEVGIVRFSITMPQAFGGKEIIDGWPNMICTCFLIGFARSLLLP